MRIGIISQEYPPETAKGGIGTQSFLKANGLAEQGHDVRVITRAVSGSRSIVKAGNVEVIRITSSNRLAHSEIADWVAYSCAVAEEISWQHSERPFDVIDFPEWACEGFVHLLNQTQWNCIPTVIHLHGPLAMLSATTGWPGQETEFYRTGTAMEAACLRLANGVFSSSHCSAGWCSREYGLDSDTVPTIHAGVDTNLFRPGLGTKAKKPTIVFAGKLADNKGVGWLVDSFIELKQEFPGVQLRLAGSGEKEVVARLKSKLEGKKLDRSVQFLGYLQPHELANEMSSAHLVAAPSRYEGGPGYVYLEAMACGIPVIGCKGSGSSEVIIDGETGILVDPTHRAELTEALRRLLENPTLAHAMGERGRQHVLETADSVDCIQRIADFYRGVVRRCRDPHITGGLGG